MPRIFAPLFRSLLAMGRRNILLYFAIALFLASIWNGAHTWATSETEEINFVERPTEISEKSTLESLIKERRRYDRPDAALRFQLAKRKSEMSDLSVGPGYLTHPGRLQEGAPHETLSRSWTFLGPDSFGGRTRALVAHPDFETTPVLYAATVFGGVWKSLDGGEEWKLLTSSPGNLPIRAMAIDTRDPDVLFIGTGDLFTPNLGWPGAGIFSTRDGGETWLHLPATSTRDFRYVNDLAVDREGSLYAATGTGVWRSDDAGELWTPMLIDEEPMPCFDLVIRRATDRDELLVACGTPDGAGLYLLSEDERRRALWEPDMGRVSLAVAPSNPEVIYALAASLNPDPKKLHGLHALFRSQDGGRSWERRVDGSQQNLGALLLSNPIYARLTSCGVADHDELLHQGWHNNAIAVDPQDPDVVWVGGVDLFRSQDGGKSWGVASAWWFDQIEQGGRDGYVHADQHALVFASQGNGEPILFVANDGGVFRSDNPRDAVARGEQAVCELAGNEVRWQALNRRLGGVHIQAADVNAEGSRFLLGTQDQGMLLGVEHMQGTTWRRLLVGDGGSVAFSPTDPAMLFMAPAGSGVKVLRATDAESLLTRVEDGGQDDFFVPPLRIDARSRLWTGGRALWRSDDAGGSWQQVGPDLGMGNVRISAIEISPSDPDRLLVGLSDGRIYSGFANSDSKSSWPMARPREGYVSSLHIDADDPQLAWATYSTLGEAHVWHTTNAGISWQPIDRRGEHGLPDVPVHGIAIDSRHPGRATVGTDHGLFTTFDDGAHWQAETTPFGIAMIESLIVVHGEVVVFTQGRGVWRGSEEVAADSIPLKAETDVHVEKTVDLVTAVPGDLVTYLITVSNDGLEAATDITIDDTFDAALESVTWTCTPQGGALCTMASGNGDLSLSVDLPVGDAVDIEATARVAGGTPTGTLSNTASVILGDLIDPEPGNNSAQADFEVIAADFGDAPAPYPTLATDDGARHVFDPALGLGSAPDVELDGQPDPDAKGDDPDAADDDDGDGVFFLDGDLVICTDTSTIRVFALIPVAQTAFLNGWIDFNGDGDWDDLGEQIVTDVELDPGITDVDFTVPCDAVATLQTFARFRLSSAGGVGPTGRAEDGEVEDHAVTIVSQSDISVIKTLDTAPIPGTEMQYTITVCNNGPSPAELTLDDAFPNLTDVEWSCTPTTLASCAATGMGPLVAEPIGLPAELGLPEVQCVTLVATGDLAPNLTGSLTNTAAATLTSGEDPVPGDNTAMVSHAMEPTADLVVTKTNHQDYAVLDDVMSYTITVENTGPSDAPGVLVSDAFEELSTTSWTCSAEAGASCGASSGSGSLNETVTLPVGGRVTYVATGMTFDTGDPDTVSNTATASWSGGVDPDPANNSATDTDPLLEVDYGDAPDCAPQPDCAPPSYSTLLENDGARHQIVRDIFMGTAPDAELDGQPTTPARGDDLDGLDDEDGFINVSTADFIACETTSLTLATTVDGGSVGTDTGFLNGWVDFDGNGSWEMDEQVFTDEPLGDGLQTLSIDIPCDAQPGYSYLRLRFSTATGLLPHGFAVDGEVEDYRIEILGLDYGDALDCTPQPTCGSGYPTLRENDGARHVEGSQIFLGAAIDAEPMALISASADGDDLDGTDDEDGITFLPTNLVAGYTITSLVPGLESQIDVTIPAGCDTRICVLQGWIDFDSDQAWEAGEQIIHNVVLTSGVHTLAFTPPDLVETTTGVTTVARFRLASEGDLDPVGLAENGEVEDHPVDIIPVANLMVTKTTTSAVVPGTMITYEVTIENPGPNPAAGITVADELSDLLTGVSWTCSGAGGGLCAAGGAGDLLDATVELPVGGSVTYVITGDLVSDARILLGEDPLVNTATVTLPEGVVHLEAADLRTISDTVEDSVVPTADLAVTIDDSRNAATPGTALNWSIQVTNLGPSDAPGTRIVNTFPEIQAGSVTWTCPFSAGGASCPPDGTGLPDLLVDLPVGGQITLSVNGILDSAALGTTQNLVDVIPDATVQDPVSSNDQDLDDNTILVPEALLSLTKIDLGDPVFDGGLARFDLTVCNQGPSDALNVRVTDTLPTEIMAGATTGCAEEGASGVGYPTCTLGTIAAGLCSSYVLDGTTAAAVTELVTNTAVVASDTLLLPAVGDDPSEDLCIVPAGGEFPLSMLSGELETPAVAASDDGFIAVWTSTGGEGTDLLESSLRGQRFSATGLPVDAGFQINSHEPGSQDQPAVAVAPDGRFVAAWRSETSPEDDDDDTSIQGQLYAADGTAIGGQFQVNTSITGAQQHPAVAMADDGSFMVVWDSFGSPTDTSNSSVQARHFDADGMPMGPQFEVNTVTNDSQEYPAIAFVGDSALPNSASFVVVWQSRTSLGSDGNGFSIQGRVFDLTDGGLPTAPKTFTSNEMQLNVDTAGDQRFPSVDGNREGTFAVAWESNQAPEDLAGGDGIGLRARRFDRDLQPLSDELPVNGGVVGPQTRPSVTLGEDRNLTVVWESTDGVDGKIIRRSFSPAGTPFAGDLEVPTFTPGDQSRPRIAADRDGDFMVVWQGPTSDCRAQKSALGRLTTVAKADLEMTLSLPVGSTPPIPGDSAAQTFQIHARNLGPAPVTDALVTVSKPVELVGVQWLCSPLGAGVVCPPGLNPGDEDPLLEELVDLPPGGEAVFTISYQLASDTHREPEVTATIAVGSGVSDPEIGNNADTLTLVPDPVADLTISKTDGLVAAVPGDGETPIVYTIEVGNAGPSAAFGARVTDTFPAGLSGCSWSCTASAGAACSADEEPGGGAQLDELVDLPAGGMVIFTVSCTLDADADAEANEGFLVNTATVMPPGSVAEPPFPAVTDPDDDNNSATDNDTLLSPSADLELTKAGPADAVRTGDLITYSLTVTNHGPSTARHVAVIDHLDPGTTFESVSEEATCTEVTGETETDLSYVCEIGDLSAGSSVTFDLTARVTLGFFDIGTDGAEVSNTASVQSCVANCAQNLGLTTTPDPFSGNNDASVITTVRADFLINDPAAGGRHVLPSVAADASGNFIVVWEADLLDVNERDIRARRYTAAGAPFVEGDFTVNTLTTGDQAKPQVAMTPSGDFMVVWENATSEEDFSYSIRGKLYNASGGVIKEDFQVNTLTFDAQINAEIAANPDPAASYRYLVVWQGRGEVVEDPSEQSIRGQRFDALGNKVGGEFQANTFTDEGQIRPSVTIDAKGNFAIAWESSGSDSVAPGSDDSADQGKSIQARLFKADGTPRDEDFQLNRDIVEVQEVPSIFSTPGGELYAVWQSVEVNGTELRGRAFCRDGRPMPIFGSIEEDVISDGDGDHTQAALAFLDHQDFVFVWQIEEVIDSPTSRYLPGAGGTKADRVIKKRIRRNRHEVEIVGDDRDIVIEEEIDVSTPDVARLGDPKPLDKDHYVVVWSQDNQIYARILETEPKPPAFLDEDQDTVPDGCDRCPGLGYSSVTDDTIDSDDNGIPDCAEVDLVITKDNGVTQGIPGEDAAPYVITVSNNGPGHVTGAHIEDLFPAELGNISWSCAAVGNASCVSGGPVGESKTGQDELAIDVDIAAGGEGFARVVIIVNATIDPAAMDSLTNTATVAPPPLFVDPDESNNSASDTDDLGIEGDLAITKTNDVDAVIPGTEVTYTLVVSNTGPSDAFDASVNDDLPDDLENVSWNCAPSARCNPATGTGDIVDLLVDVMVGSPVTVTATGTLAATATGTLTNTASMTAPAGFVDSDSNNDSASDSDPITPQTDLGVTKDAGVDEIVPGEAVVWTLVVTNHGPIAVNGAGLSDDFPVECQSVTWCQGPSCDPQTGTAGDLDVTLGNLPVDGSVTYRARCVVDPGARDNLVNTATVTPPGGIDDPESGNDSAIESVSLAPRADLKLTKDDQQISVVAGESLTYEIEVTNLGPSDVYGAKVNDAFPTDLDNCSWTCTPTGDAACVSGPPLGSSINGNIVDAEIDLAVGAGNEITFMATCTVKPSASGELTNQATVSVPQDTVDPVPGNNDDTDIDTVIRSSDLAITKSDGQTTATPGTSVTYTIEVTNAGPSDAVGAQVNDTFQAPLQDCSWTCSGVNGSCDPTNGSGDIAAAVDVAVGGKVTFTATCDIDPAATGVLINTVSVTGNDPDGSNNTAIDQNTLVPRADLKVMKDSGGDEVEAGGSVIYTITVTNLGPSNSRSCVVNDLVPDILNNVSWSCAGAHCGSTTGVDDIIDQPCNLPPNESVVFTLTGDLPSSAMGMLENTVTVTAGDDPSPDPNPNTATDSDQIVKSADLSIVKDNGQGTLTAGEEVTYTLTVTNAGPADVMGAQVTDMPPSDLNNVTWRQLADAAMDCDTGTAAFNGNGDIDRPVDLPAGGTVKLCLTGTVDPSTTAPLTNQATVTPPAGVTDPDPSNNTDADTDTIKVVADMGITKDNGVTEVVAGTSVSYTIVVTNHGPSASRNCVVEDDFPTDLESVSWMCSGTHCTNASGNGELVDEPCDLPPGESLTFTATAILASSASDMLSNTATVTSGDEPTPDPNPNSATDTDSILLEADLGIVKDDGLASVTPGNTVTYTITVTNLGPSDVEDATVFDAPPAGLTDVTWRLLADPGTSCPDGTATVTGPDTINLPIDLVAGGMAKLCLSGTVDPAATEDLINTATITPPVGVTDPGPTPNMDDDQNTLTPSADVAITKSNGVDGVVAGSEVMYEIVVTNSGPSDAIGCNITDTFPVELTNVTWGCESLTDQSGSLAYTTDIATGTSVTCTATGALDAAATDTLENTAEVSCTTTDPDEANNAASDSDAITPGGPVVIFSDGFESGDLSEWSAQ